MYSFSHLKIYFNYILIVKFVKIVKSQVYFLKDENEGFFSIKAPCLEFSKHIIATNAYVLTFY